LSTYSLLLCDDFELSRLELHLVAWGIIVGLQFFEHSEGPLQSKFNMQTHTLFVKVSFPNDEARKSRFPSMLMLYGIVLIVKEEQIKFFFIGYILHKGTGT
jgi:hypothetical protein